MFRKLSIDRFRGFKRLRMEGLERFNLVLGRNNVGKTAFLEAIFLLVGPTNPELPLKIGAMHRNIYWCGKSFGQGDPW